jgi:hypothetical protein
LESSSISGKPLIAKVESQRNLKKRNLNGYHQHIAKQSIQEKKANIHTFHIRISEKITIIRKKEIKSKKSKSILVVKNLNHGHPCWLEYIACN